MSGGQAYVKEDYLSLHEAALMLDIRDEEMQKLVHRHQVQTHLVAGVFLRLRKKDVEQLKNKWRIERELFPKAAGSFAHDTPLQGPRPGEKLKDFWYFNDFYILCSCLILVLLFFILTTQ